MLLILFSHYCCCISYCPIRKVETTLDTSSREEFKCKRFVTEVLEELEEQKERACRGASGRRRLLPNGQEAALGRSPGACTHRQLWPGCCCCCCCWSHIAAAGREPRSQHSAGVARACGMCSCLQSSTVAHCYCFCCLHTDQKQEKKLYLSSCHPVSSLGQSLTGGQGQWAKASWKYIVPVFQF